VCARIAIVYNQPVPCRYHLKGEEAAVTGVLNAVKAVCCALQELDYEVVRVPLAPPIKQAKGQLSKLDTDLVFNLFEGFCGYPETEAEIPDILSALGMPYTGSPGKALRLALDKVKTKILLKANGINTPDFQLLDTSNIAAFNPHYPCIIKPPAEDASHGLSEKSVVYDLASLREQLADFQRDYTGQALVEEFINGREFNITVMGNSRLTALPISEIDYLLPQGKPQILTFDAKWQPDSLYFKGTKVICPAEIEDENRKQITEISLAAFSLLGCRGYARVDMRSGDGGRLYVIEVNPNPDISPGSGAVRQAEAAGLTYTQFIKKIVELAMEKENEESQHPADGKGRQASLDGDTTDYARI
jgi:D-alanine-D-alanine ligase